ncbi:MAG: cupin domain-containing protein [Polynucleobacter sp.]
MKPQIKKPYEPPKAPQPLPIKAPWALLGGISPKRFMKEYWQKKPLLVRGAIPAFALSGQSLASPLSMADLANLAGQKNVESRLIKSKPWSLGHGPFKKSEIPALNEKDWTLLVQGVNGHHPAAKTVMSWFRFIPEARLDDLMISIAGPNGGVGPHVDSYDVFLLQMAGRRRWRISDQKDLSLKDGLPLKILKNFEATDDWVLEPGDMLYLPPNIAHDGIALDAGCQTWSVGFRVPTYKELVNEILWRTTEALENDPEFCRLYTDPHQPATKDSALVPDELIKVIQNKLNGIHWSKSDVSCTLAAVLSEPKPQVVFTPPTPLLGFAEFKKALRTQGLELSPLSKALYDKDFLYLNGESMSDSEAEDWDFWCHLAQNHTLPAAMASRLASLLDHPDNPWFEAYQSGWLQLMNS